jgi:sarcosine oxidase subunit alpha
LANGVRTASRSLKFHRPRGVLCLGGRCFSCLARVDGVPNVRTCRVACRDGMTVRRESAVPQAGCDVLRAFDFAFPKSLEYHEMFTRPAPVNKMLQRAVRVFSGGGDLPDRAAPAPAIREKAVEVAVIGGGPAGMAAALTAAAAGARTLLVDDAPELGGHLVGWPEPLDGFADGPAWIQAQLAALDKAGVEVALGAECLGRYREGFWAFYADGALTLLTPRRTVLATGAYDQPPLFPNNDLPGIFSTRGVSKLVHRWGVRPGDACLILGVDDLALSLAERLPEMGVRVVGLATEARQVAGDPDRAEKIRGRGVPIFLGYRAARARGALRLKGLRLEPLDGGEPVDAPCDVVAAGGPPAPSWELAAQAGGNVIYDAARGGFAATCDKTGRTANSDVFVTGEMLGAAPALTAAARGRAAGLAAALDLHPDETVAAELRRTTEN